MLAVSPYTSGRTNIPIAVSFLYEREYMLQMDALLAQYEEECDKPAIRSRRSVSERHGRSPLQKKKKHSPSMTMKSNRSYGIATAL